MTISTLTFATINTGTSPNDGQGETLRAAFIKVNQNFANISDVGFDAGNISVQGSLVLANVFVPTAYNSTGSKGQLAWDNEHLYICIANNSWKRANIAAW